VRVASSIACAATLAACGSATIPPADDRDGGTHDGAPRIDADPARPDAVPPGTRLFRDDLPWTRDVSDLAPSAESAAIIGALAGAGGWGTGDFRTDMSIDIQEASATTPRIAITAKDEAWAQATYGDPSRAEFYRPDCDDAPMPVPPDGAVEGESGYACAHGGDCHLIVIDRAARTLHEMWRADRRGDTLYGGCVAIWHLDADYDPDRLRGRGCSSADAGGFPIAAMLATADEVATGRVDHALRFILPNARIRRGVYVSPATHSTFPTSGGNSLPPYGVRLRLRAAFPESSLPSEGARVLARALKRYGMFLADGGNLPLTIASDRYSTARWSDLGIDAHSLSALRASDFEVVEYGNPVDWRADTTCTRAP